MSDILSVDWVSNPLVPAIAQDSQSGDVLMLAYMNLEAYRLTLSTGFAHYYSRSKKRIWKKGESSGHTQEVKAILLDCDADSILLKVKQEGVACHTGRKSCFYNDVKSEQKISQPSVDIENIYSAVDILYHEILNKQNADPSKSYTAKLFSKGENTIGKKLIEEAGELALSIKDDDENAVVYEAADLVYHALVALAYKKVSPDMVRNELLRRMGTSGIEEKSSRKD